jgi:hypothetical protein
MLSDIGATRVSSNRGRSKPRTLKSNTKPLFPVRPRGTQTQAKERVLELVIVK